MPWHLTGWLADGLQESSSLPESFQGSGELVPEKVLVQVKKFHCLNAGRTHVLFLMLKTASVMRRSRMNLVHFSIAHDQSHSPFLDGVPAKNRCYAQGCSDPITSYEPSLSSTCVLSTCWLLDEVVGRFIFKKV